MEGINIDDQSQKIFKIDEEIDNSTLNYLDLTERQDDQSEEINQTFTLSYDLQSQFSINNQVALFLRNDNNAQKNKFNKGTYNSTQSYHDITLRIDDQSEEISKTFTLLYDLQSYGSINNQENLILRKDDDTYSFNKIDEGQYNQIENQLDLTLRKDCIQKYLKDKSNQNSLRDSELNDSNLTNKTNFYENKNLFFEQEIQDNSIDINFLVNENKKFNEQGISDNTIHEIFNNSGMRYKYKKNEIDMIHENLIKRNYKISNYFDSGGQADLFEGYFLNNEGKQENYVFKIYFEMNNKEFEQEVNNIKNFENSKGIVKIIDYFQIYHLFILVIEKCQYSLKKELQMFKKEEKQFGINDLLQILFDLICGLNLFRIYNILHLDIKSSNILKTENGSYCFTDFSTSKKKEKNNEIDILSYVLKQAPTEQINRQNIDYKCDVYSLGRTLKQVINVFKIVNKEQLQNVYELINQFQFFIEENMIQTEVNKRQNCLEIHDYFLKIVIQQNFDYFYLQYTKNLFGLLNLYQFDINKDILHFQQFTLFMNKSILKLIQKHSNLNLYILSKYFFKTYKSYHIIGDFQMALQYLLKVFTKVKQYFSQNHPIIAFFLNEIGTSYQKIGDNHNAKIFLFQSLELKQNIFYKNHPDIAISLTNIGKFYLQQGNKEDSLYYLQKSLEMRNQIYKGTHPYIVQSLYDLSLSYKLCGDIESYRKNLFDSHEMILQIFQGKNHSDIGKSLNNMGLYYFFISDFKNAQNYFLRSLEIRKQIHHGNHPDIALSLNNIGICYDKQGQHKKAIQYYLESFEIIQKIFPSNHPVIIKYLNNIERCYFYLGQYIKYQLENLEMRKKLYQTNHLEISLCLNNVGLSYQLINDNFIAIEYLYESFDMKKQIFQGNHIEIAISLDNIGEYFKQIGKNQEALKNFMESLEMKKVIFEINHIEIALSLNNVGLCYQCLGEYKRAIKYLLESFVMQKQTLKGDNIGVAKTLNNIGILYNKVGENQIGLKYIKKFIGIIKRLNKQSIH